jgi:hypothetical protein
MIKNEAMPFASRDEKAGCENYRVTESKAAGYI